MTTDLARSVSDIDRDEDGGVDVVVDADVLGRNRTGDETYISSLLDELGRDLSGLRVAAIARDASLVPPGIVAVELPVRLQASRLGLRLPLRLRRLGAGLAHFQYVVPPAYRGAAVVTIHDLSFERLPEMENRVDGWLLRQLVPASLCRAAAVITGSNWSKTDIVERYGVDESLVTVTPYGVSPMFSPVGPRSGGSPYLLFVGALRPRKDPICALEALRRLGGGLRMVMVGPDKGLLSEVRRYVAEHHLEEAVELRGHVEREELLALYRGALCLVLPSRYEGFGLPVVEAMASGTPVVATSVSCLPEVAGGAAVLVAPGDPDDLARGISEALADRDRLVAAGIARARSFRWSETARLTAQVYRRVLSLDS